MKKNNISEWGCYCNFNFGLIFIFFLFNLSACLRIKEKEGVDATLGKN
jgi:hypothetical protein